MHARGGHSQADVAAMVGCGKGDASECARFLRGSGIGAGELEAMSGADAASTFAAPPGGRDGSRLQVDAPALVEGRSGDPRPPLGPMRAERREAASAARRLPCPCPRLCETFSEGARRPGAPARLAREPGQRACVGWAGDVAWPTGRATGGRAEACVPVTCLPRSGWVWAGGYAGMPMGGWQDGRMRALEAIGGVPRVPVPGSRATATDRAGAGVTGANDAYGRLAGHHGRGILPERVRRPRDKGLAEGTVDMAGRWAIAPSRGPRLRGLGELNDCLGDGVGWPNAREVPGCGAPRDERPLEGLPHLPPPPSRHEVCGWRRPRVAPDCHVRVGHMRHPVPLAPVGRTVGVGVTGRAVRVMDGGEVVAGRPGPRGGRGRYPTDESHMPPEHRDARGPRSRESLGSRADGVGPATGECVRGVPAPGSVVERALAACRSIPGLSRSRSPELPERACARFVAGPAVPGHTAPRGTIATTRAEGADGTPAGPGTGMPAAAAVGRAESAGRAGGADAWERGEWRARRGGLRRVCRLPGARHGPGAARDARGRVARLVGPRGEGEGDDRRRGGRRAGEEGGEAGEGGPPQGTRGPRRGHSPHARAQVGQGPRRQARRVPVG